MHALAKEIWNLIGCFAYISGTESPVNHFHNLHSSHPHNNGVRKARQMGASEPSLLEEIHLRKKKRWAKINLTEKEQNQL